LDDRAFKQWPEGALNLNVAEERLEGEFKNYPLVITPRIKTPITHYLEIGLKTDPSGHCLKALSSRREKAFSGS
ncbi:MAG: hypothetical protein AAFR66_13055, partial [Bacteroidota bacterium]